jgi:hypothetical protein
VSSVQAIRLKVVTEHYDPSLPPVLRSSPTHYPRFDNPNNFQIPYEARISIRVSTVFMLPCADSGLATGRIRRLLRPNICLRSIAEGK